MDPKARGISVRRWRSPTLGLALLLLPLASLQANRIYRLTFHTSNRSKSGTDSNISVRLFGTQGDSDWHKVNSHLTGNAFESGDTDKCDLSLGDHGAIWRVDIKSDGAHPGSDWDLEALTISSSKPDLVATSHFLGGSNHQWIDGPGYPHGGVHTIYADEYHPPTESAAFDQTFSTYTAYPIDNRAGTSQRSLGVVHHLVISRTEDYSSSTANSTTHQFQASWQSPDTFLGKFGGSYQQGWTSEVSKTASHGSSVTLETQVNLGNLLVADPGQYVLVIVRTDYQYRGAKITDEFSGNQAWYRSLVQTPVPRPIWTFTLGDSVPQDVRPTWALWTEPDYREAVSEALGDQFSTLQAYFLQKGWIVGAPNRSPEAH